MDGEGIKSGSQEILPMRAGSNQNVSVSGSRGSKLDCTVTGLQLRSTTEVNIAGQGVIPTALFEKTENVITIPSAKQETLKKDFSANADMQSILESEKKSLFDLKVKKIGVERKMSPARDAGTSDSNKDVVGIDEEIRLLSRGLNPLQSGAGEFNVEKDLALNSILHASENSPNHFLSTVGLPSSRIKVIEKTAGWSEMAGSPWKIDATPNQRRLDPYLDSAYR